LTPGQIFVVAELTRKIKIFSSYIIL